MQFSEDYIDLEFNLVGTTQSLGASGATENYAATALNVWQEHVSKEMLHPPPSLLWRLASPASTSRSCTGLDSPCSRG